MTEQFDPIPNQDEDFDGESWDEFSWMIPYLVQYGIEPQRFLNIVGPSLKELGGLTNEEVDKFLLDTWTIENQRQLNKIRR